MTTMLRSMSRPASHGSWCGSSPGKENSISAAWNRGISRPAWSAGSQFNPDEVGMKQSIAFAFAVAAGLATPAWAPKPADGPSAHPGAATGQAAPLAEGEVRKVDKAAKKITLKHGPIPNIDMPAMTMVFPVKD